MFSARADRVMATWFWDAGDMRKATRRGGVSPHPRGRSEEMAGAPPAPRILEWCPRSSRPKLLGRRAGGRVCEDSGMRNVDPHRIALDEAAFRDLNDRLAEHDTEAGYAA